MERKHEFRVEKLTAGYDRKTILHDIDLKLLDGEISVIIGANGCGKSTLLKTMAKLIKPMSGEVILDGKAISKIPAKEFARTLGVLPQERVLPEGITVVDLISRGRYPHHSLLSSMSKADYEAVAEAMEMMDITAFANRDIEALSGGQKQRVWIAMALAQQTDILFLDEPTTFLDITYQVEILDLLTDLNRKYGTTIVMVLHDINLAVRYAEHVFALKEGVLIAEGKASSVITSELIKEVFALDCTVITDPVSGTPLVVPKGRYHRDKK
ncbi:Probable siderophore transport system ATP-binding protein YusV [Listeria grayi]|nr:ABC transporter ATP-binding protein [Listeria grayi]EUJ26377.1 iron ABC transporter ATP-binding protein [Listeria grayi FSL F6-1183]MBC1921734.1 ABC transporter ATP-binding protein [Listeria grayi]VEI31733.1 Probable siderophore transport system ATP-binding protein YusV [Listeria grayi]